MYTFWLLLLACSHFYNTNGILDKNKTLINQDVFVTIPQGTLNGRLRLTKKVLAFHRNPITYASFEGIPYAIPPVGNLRFKNPLPNTGWNGIYNAKQCKAKCPQITEIFEVFEGEEDCLYINVYTRNLEPKKPRPVFVILHGGRFRVGAGNFVTPIDLLLEINPVIVTFNFRLSILGLLSLNNENAPGNLQSKDQVLALQWVRDNIAYFGGDPNNVALYGPSSGAVSAYLLQLSPMAKGLFHKAILNSGAFLCEWNTGYDPVEVAKDFTSFLGFTSNNTDEILAYLMQQTEQRLVQGVFDYELENGVEVFKFGLVLDSNFEKDQAFLPSTPSLAYKSGTFNDVPVIFSYTSREFAFYVRDDKILQRYLDRADAFIPTIWNLPIGSKLHKETITKIKEFYFGTTNIDLNNPEHFENCIKLIGDIMFVMPIMNAIRSHAIYSKSPVYVYKFTYRGGLNHPNIEKFGFQGATHSDDKAYVFPMTNKTLDFKSSDNYVRKRHLTLFSNFLETSDPTPGPFTNMLPFKWLPYTHLKRNYLQVDGNIVLSENPDEAKVQFWMDLEDYVIKEGKYQKNWKDICLLSGRTEKQNISI